MVGAGVATIVTVEVLVAVRVEVEVFLLNMFLMALQTVFLVGSGVGHGSEISTIGSSRLPGSTCPVKMRFLGVAASSVVVVEVVKLERDSWIKALILLLTIKLSRKKTEEVSGGNARDIFTI